MIRNQMIRLLSLAAAATVAIGVVSFPYDFWLSFGDNSLTTTSYGADFHFYDGKLALYLNCRLPCTRRISTQTAEPPPIKRYEFLDNIFDVRTTPCALHSPGCTVQHNTLLWITLWIPLLCFLSPIGLLMLAGRWQACRRRKGGLCPQCAYNLTGNLSGICPECAWIIPPEVALIIAASPLDATGGCFDSGRRRRWRLVYPAVALATVGGVIAAFYVTNRAETAPSPPWPLQRLYPTGSQTVLA